MFRDCGANLLVVIVGTVTMVSNRGDEKHLNDLKPSGFAVRYKIQKSVFSYSAFSSSVLVKSMEEVVGAANNTVMAS